MDNSDLVDASGTAVDTTGAPVPTANSLADATSAATNGGSNNFFSSFLNTLQPAVTTATGVLGAINSVKNNPPKPTTPVSAGTAASTSSNNKFIALAIGGLIGLFVVFKLLKK